MKNWKLKTKLFISYGVIFIMLVVISFSGLFGMGVLSDSALHYANITLPMVEEIGMTRRNMLSVRQYLLNAMIAQTSLDMDRVVSTMATERENLLTNLETLKQLSPTYTADIEAIEQDIQNAAAINDEIIRLCSTFTQEAKTEAYQMYLDDYAPHFDLAAEKIIALYDRIEQDSLEQENNVVRARVVSHVFILIVTIVAAVVIGVLVRMMLHFIQTPLERVVDAMDALEQGDFERIGHEPIYQSEDELGYMAKKISSTIAKINFIIDDLTHGLTNVANGNFTSDSKDPSQYTGAYKNIRDLMYNLVSMLNQTMYKVHEASEQIAGSASQVAHAAQGLGQGASEQASSVEELAATLLDISKQVDENTKNLVQAQRESQETVEELQNGSEKMKDMLNAMDEITSSSLQIEKIIKTIEDIAFQTIILALNAAIEAARAGQAGKGFAVVAEEVRNLAAKTTESSQNTATLIQQALTAVQNGKHIADETAESFNKIFKSIQQSTERTEQITKNSMAQDEAIHQTSQGVDSISSVIQTNSATAQESAAASEELSGQAQLLQQLLSQFTLLPVSPSKTATASVSTSSLDTEYKY